MPDLREVAAYVTHYKCFGPGNAGFDTLEPINLIIGRNNSGKSSLLDVLESGINGTPLTRGHAGGSPRLVLRQPLTESDLLAQFPSGTSGGDVPNRQDHWEFARPWVGKRITWEQAPDTAVFIGIDPPLPLPNPERYGQALVARLSVALRAYRFRRLAAERDIRPENDRGLGTPIIAANGDGATDALMQFMTRASLPSALVKETVLASLNRIFAPDATFSRIEPRRLGDGSWELFLDEQGKGEIPLSQSGSGIKTILLILAFIHLVPHIESTPLARYVYGLEEPENNLHPALQRRLFLFLREQALVEHCHFFITTHSSVVIDLFANDPEAQIIHVVHNRTAATAHRVQTYVHHGDVLDDLDVRASDLLQANGIVWLEGPSDRLYFNHWIKLVYGDALREGAHYQCVFYGGRLLAHLSASEPEMSPDDVVKILRVNRNGVVLMDSDRRDADSTINATKERISEEISSTGGMAWVTAGREVENYLPVEALRSYYKRADLQPLARYESISDYIDAVLPGEGSTTMKKKVLFAEHILPHVKAEHIEGVLDLASRIREVGSMIQQWNRLPPPPTT
jgi:putative ATP-dependent endonuclease of OLD family